MKYVIASVSAKHVDTCRNAVQATDIEFRVGPVPATWYGCDAAVMWWPIAYERYAGTPEPGVAQVLINDRGDDAPEMIIATPPGPGLTTGIDPAEADVENYSFAVLDSCVEAFSRRFPETQDGAVILIHLEAAGLDKRDMAAPIRGITRFLTQRRRS